MDSDGGFAPVPSTLRPVTLRIASSSSCLPSEPNVQANVLFVQSLISALALDFPHHKLMNGRTMLSSLRSTDGYCPPWGKDDTNALSVVCRRRTLHRAPESCAFSGIRHDAAN
jgi:hypothetical protein